MDITANGEVAPAESVSADDSMKSDEVSTPIMVSKKKKQKPNKLHLKKKTRPLSDYEEECSSDMKRTATPLIDGDISASVRRRSRRNRKKFLVSPKDDENAILKRSGRNKNQ